LWRRFAAGFVDYLGVVIVEEADKDAEIPRIAGGGI